MKEIDVDTDTLARHCGAVPPEPGAQGLLDCVKGQLPDLVVRLIMTDAGWYRVGGVVTADDKKIADDLETWAGKESGGDVMELMARFGDSGYLATEIAGSTHWLNAPLGDGPLDFVQIEVEEVQEVVARELFREDWFPDSLEDVVDPLDFRWNERRPLGSPRYVFKKLEVLANQVGELTNEYSGDPRFKRFLDEWSRSSAGHAVRFCDHWVVTVIPYLDSMGDHMREVKLLSPHAVKAPKPARAEAASGQQLADLIHELDTAAGFPMAWYFLMLTVNFAPYRTIQAIHDQVTRPGGFAFLPERDLKILEDWLEEPYHL